uniref:Putative secreted protein n=1 Tax=Ixodes scapularis TaxID=6945 RepID=A0A4D5RCF8_IXOSC
MGHCSRKLYIYIFFFRRYCAFTDADICLYVNVALAKSNVTAPHGWYSQHNMVASCVSLLDLLAPSAPEQRVYLKM